MQECFNTTAASCQRTDHPDHTAWVWSRFCLTASHTTRGFTRVTALIVIGVTLLVGLLAGAFFTGVLSTSSNDQGSSRQKQSELPRVLSDDELPSLVLSREDRVDTSTSETQAAPAPFISEETTIRPIAPRPSRTPDKDTSNVSNALDSSESRSDSQHNNQITQPDAFSEPVSDAETAQQSSSDEADNTPWKLGIVPFRRLGENFPESDLSVQVASRITASIDTDQFQLISRIDLGAIREEQRFQASSIAEAGRQSGVDFILTGDLIYTPSIYSLTARVVDCRSGAIFSQGATDFIDGYDFGVAMQSLAVDLRLAPESARPDRDPIRRPRTPGDRRPAPSPDPIRDREPIRQPIRQPSTGVLTGNDLLDVTNPHASFSVTATTNTGRDLFTDGDEFYLVVESQRSGYVSVVFANPQGRAEILVPGTRGIGLDSQLIGASIPLAIPTLDQGTTRQRIAMFDARPPHGATFLRFIVTPEPLTQNDFYGYSNVADLKGDAKAIGLRTTPNAQPAGAGFGAASVLDKRFGHRNWATTSLLIRTFPDGRSPVRQPNRSDAIPPDPRDTLVLQEILSRFQEDVPSKPLPPSTNPETPAPDVQELIVVRRVATTKSIGGWGYNSELVQIPQAVKAAANTDPITQSIEQIKRNDKSVVAVIPNFWVTNYKQPHHQQSISTPMLTHQWGLRNAIAPLFDIGWEDDTALSEGAEPLLVAVVDSGLALDDPRCRAFLWTNPDEIPGNGIDDDENGYIDDIHGWDMVENDADVRGDDPEFNHGSFCASIIAGRATGAINDVIGVSSNTQILPVRVLSSIGGTQSTVFDGIEYAMNAGARIINLSLGHGGDPSNPLPHQVIADYEAHPIWAELERRGVLVVIAAGNNYNDNDRFPALPANVRRSNIITVMGHDASGRLSRGLSPSGWEPFSNYGKNSVHIAAPGSQVLGITQTNQTSISDGTSYAAPMVAGAAAVLWTRNPSWSVQQLRDALLNSARPVAGLETKCSTGGILDLSAAMKQQP